MRRRLISIGRASPSTTRSPSTRTCGRPREFPERNVVMILAVLQARTASTRMPGKVMAPICGEPMIWRQLERIRTARSISKVVVATTVDPSDDGLAAFLLGRGVSVHRGEFKNVLGRFSACAEAWDAAHVVRLSADCPLIDPQLIDAAAGLALKTGADYVGN